MGELSQLHHQQSTRHFGEKQKLNHQRSSWHLFAYNLLCCLQLQRQRIGLHPGWLEDRFLRNWFHHLGLENGEKRTRGIQTLIQRKLHGSFQKITSQATTEKLSLFQREESWKKRFLEGNTCHLCENKWMLKWMDALVSKGLLNHQFTKRNLTHSLVQVV